MDLIDFTLFHPCNIQIVGPTLAGKTSLAIQIIKRRREIFSKPLEKVIYIHFHDEDGLESLRSSDLNISFSNNIEELQASALHDTLICIDDHMNSIESNKSQRLFVQKLFTQYSHHQNLSLIFILQNPFVNNFRTINLSTRYLILFDQCRDRSTIQQIAKQVSPGKPQVLSEAYEKACAKRGYRYLVLDLHPLCKNPKYFLRNSVFPVNGSEVYVSTNTSYF